MSSFLIRLRSFGRTAGIAALIVFLGPVLAAAATWHVEPDGSGDFPDIASAVAGASSGDEITLGDGTFVGAGNRGIDTAGKELIIRSASGVAAACMIDLENVDVAAFVLPPAPGSDVTLENFTITNAGTEAVLFITGSPTVRGLDIAAFGRRAVRADGGNPILDDVTIRDGGSGATDGIVWSDDGALTLSDCLFEGNTLAASAEQIRIEEPTSVLIERTVFASVNQPVATNACIGVDRFAPNGRVPIVVRDCEIQDYPGRGVRVGSRDVDVLVEGGTITTVSDGVRLYSILDSCALEVVGATLRGVSGGFSSFAVSATGARDVSIRQTTIEDRNQGIDSWSATGPIEVLDSTVRCSDRAAEFRHPNVTVTNAEFRGGSVRVVDVGMASFSSSLFAGAEREGLFVLRSSADVSRCTIASTASRPSSAWAGLFVQTASTVTLSESIVWGNCAGTGAEVYVQSTASLDVQCSTVGPGLIDGPGTITSTSLFAFDPLFCGPDACANNPSAAGDYDLQTGSPAFSAPCGPIGAPAAICAATSSAQLESLSWSRVKAAYR